MDAAVWMTPETPRLTAPCATSPYASSGGARLHGQAYAARPPPGLCGGAQLQGLCGGPRLQALRGGARLQAGASSILGAAAAAVALLSGSIPFAAGGPPVTRKPTAPTALLRVCRSEHCFASERSTDPRKTNVRNTAEARKKPSASRSYPAQ
jgi:hypothetical protein